MRRRTLLTSAGLSAAALAATVTVTAVVVGQSSADASISTLLANEKFTGLFTEDLGKKGPSLGDHLAFRTSLTALNGDPLAFSGGDCVLLKGTTEANAVYHCSQSYRFTSGSQLYVGGIFTFARKVNTWQILGGTGKYRGASGQATFTTVTEDSFKDTFLFD